MFGQFPRYTCIRKQEIHSRKNRAVSAEALLQQLLLLLLVTLPFPSFTTNTTWKARKLFNNNRDAHENSHHFTMNLGYHVSDVPPSDGPLQDLVIRYIFYNENNNVTLTTRASWYLWSILSIDEDAQTISLDATIRFQWNSTSLERHQGIRNFLWPGKAPSAAGAMCQLQQVEFFTKIPTAESNNERRRKNLS